MQTTLKTLLFIVAIAAVIGSGLLGGKLIADNQKPPTQEEIALKEARLEAKKQQKLQRQKEKEEARARAKIKSKAKYQAAQPHFGPLIHMTEITVEYPEDQADTAIGFITKQARSKVKELQDVILYDQEDYVLPLGGEVIDIDDDEESEKYKVTISLPKGTNTEYLSKNLEIITFKTIASKRLPHSAIQTDSNGETYVWLAYTDKANTAINRIKKLPITVGTSDSDYFEEYTHKIEANDYIVINPDKTLQSNKSYTFDPIQLDAPLHSPIKQAWIDYEIYKHNAIHEEIDAKLAKCRGGTVKVATNTEYNPFDYDNPSIGDTTHACSDTAPTTGPLAIFNALTNNKTTSSDTIDVTGGGCGGTAAACSGSGDPTATASCSSGCSAQ